MWQLVLILGRTATNVWEILLLHLVLEGLSMRP